MVCCFCESVSYLDRHPWRDILADARNPDDETAAKAAYADLRRWMTAARGAEELNDDAQQKPTRHPQHAQQQP